MTTSPPVRFGYVDESIHDSAGLYVVALVSAVPSLADQVRGVLAACVPAVRRPHWHGEDEATKYALVRAVATLPIEAKVYGCRFAVRGRQEAARARALGWAVTDLGRGVRHLVVDRRQEQQNLKDRRVLSGLAGRPARYTFTHCSSESEPMLWLPDIVVGAAASHLTGREELHLKALGRIVRGVMCEQVTL